MKGETQADALASLVQKKKQYPEYEVALPAFMVKHSILKKLAKDDLLLVGLSELDMVLYAKDELCADVKLFSDENIQKLKITYLHKDTLQQEHTKKYEIVKCSFGTLQSRKLEVGYKVGIAQLDLEKAKLFVNDKHIADGKLVEVDNEIAVQIIKVNKK